MIGDPIRTLTIITGEPNELVAPIHNRNPVILPHGARRRWLGEEEAEADDLLALLRPFPAELMRAYPVGASVGNVRNTSIELLELGGRMTVYSNATPSNRRNADQSGGHRCSTFPGKWQS